MNESLQRFFVEINAGAVGPEVLPPGERRLFLGRPQMPCVPQRLDLFATEQSKPDGAWDRHVKGPTMRVHEVRYGARVAKCGKDTFGPRVELSVPGVRPVRMGEDLAAVVENTTNAPLHVRVVFLTRSDDTPYILGATAYTERRTRRLPIPPSKAGCVGVNGERIARASSSASGCTPSARTCRTSSSSTSMSATGASSATARAYPWRCSPTAWP